MVLLLATGSADRTICICDVGTGKLLATLRGHTHIVKCVCFSPDSSKLASGSDDATIMIWDMINMPDFTPTIFHGHYLTVQSLVYSQDGAKLLSGSADGTVKIWDSFSGAVLFSFDNHAAHILSASFMCIENFIVSCSVDHEIKVWDFGVGTEKASFSRFGCSQCITNPARNDFAVCCADAIIVYACRLNDGLELCLEEVLQIPVTSQKVFNSYTADGAKMLSLSRAGKMSVWDFETSTMGEYPCGFELIAAAVNPKADRIAVGTSIGVVKVFDAVTGDQIYRTQYHNKSVCCACFSSDDLVLL
jgi:WD40 repeat protein